MCAILVLLYLHRRNVKKLRSEDANDKHKSLDFGLDLEPTAGGKPMRQTEKLDGWGVAQSMSAHSSLHDGVGCEERESCAHSSGHEVI